MMYGDVNFVDFDNKHEYDKAFIKANLHGTRNFVVHFNADKARCAFDLEATDIKSLLETKVDDPASSSQLPHSTRWIHLWRPEDQKDSIDSIAQHYGFSPRLALSMKADPIAYQPASNGQNRPPTRLRDRLTSKSRRNLSRTEPSEKTTVSETEIQQYLDTGAIAASLDLNHYRIVNELWHFMSVDWGRKYTSIGYNALYITKESLEADAAEPNHLRPAGRRIWWWIVLCNDGTVISIQENPFPGVDVLDHHQQRSLNSIRYNCLNVFKQLSKSTVNEQRRHPLLTVAVRSGRLPSHIETHIAEEDSPSLLLYYLFDDWYTIYSLVAKSEHQYRVKLDSIRQEMFISAKLEHVHKLHSLGRQLAVLKRMYEGYDLIIERVMNGPQQKFEPHGLILTNSDLSQTSGHSYKRTMKELEEYGVPISRAAAFRFERLIDRLNLYALSEIKSCLEEKDSLMAMNFNLIAIKGESYVERLTRITILLAKVTILFIPITLVATYFTIPLGYMYTPSQFWIAFTVTFVISVTGLMLFGIVSGTRESGLIYKSLTRSSIDAWRRIRGQTDMNGVIGS